MKLFLAVVSSCIAMGAQTVGGDVASCNAPNVPQPIPVTPPVSHVQPMPYCGCGGVTIVKVNIHNNVHIVTHVNIHNNTHNNIHNKGK